MLDRSLPLADAVNEIGNVLCPINGCTGTELDGLREAAFFDAVVPSGFSNRHKLKNLVQPQEAGRWESGCGLLMHMFLQNAADV